MTYSMTSLIFWTRLSTRLSARKIKDPFSVSYLLGPQDSLSIVQAATRGNVLQRIAKRTADLTHMILTDADTKFEGTWVSQMS